VSPSRIVDQKWGMGLCGIRHFCDNRTSVTPIGLARGFLWRSA
jgi:hypothetical protein